MNKIVCSLAALMLTTACGPDFETDDADALKGGKADGTTAPSTTTTSKHVGRTTDALAAQPVWKDTFLIAQTPEVHVAFDLQGLKKGRHQVTVFVYGNGWAYQRMDLDVAVEVAAGPGQVQAEKIGTNLYRVWVGVLVAGTAIDQYAMTGAWRADAHLAGSGAVAASAPFALQ